MVKKKQQRITKKGMRISTERKDSQVVDLMGKSWTISVMHKKVQYVYF